MKQIQTRIAQKIDTSENWGKAVNFIPLAGEIIIYSDLKKFKVGDGVTKVNKLDFYNTANGATESGGNIFGDTETNSADGAYATAFGSNSSALGDNSMVIGKEVQTGCKGYYIKAIDPASRYIYLATDGVECVPTWTNPSSYHDSSFNTEYTIITPEEIEAGEFPAYANEFSISSEDYYHWVFAADIVDISGNRIQYSEKNIMSENPDKEHAAYKKWMENFEGKAKPMKFYVPTQSYAGNIITGHYTLAVGKGSVAADDYAVAEGRYNLAVGYAAHVEGDSNRAGYTGHAEGVRTHALGLGAHTEGQETIATGRFAHAQGSGSSATGDYGHAEGFYTQATGTSSHAQGSGSIASGAGSHASGANTRASGHHSFAGGLESIASGNRSFAFGNATGAFAQYGAALGYKTQVGYADGEAGTESFMSRSVKLEKVSFEAQGFHVKYVAIPSHATQVTMTLSNIYEDVEPEGSGQIDGVFRDIAFYDSNDQFVDHLIEGTNSIPAGDVKWIRIDGYVITSGSPGYAESFADIQFDFSIPDNLGAASLAFGSYTSALGNHSLAGGLYATASGSRAFAFGEGTSDDRTEATGDNSIAMGKHVKATKTGAIALGHNARAGGISSFALGHNEGGITEATNSFAVAIGRDGHSLGMGSLTFGDGNTTNNAYSWALGQGNTTNAAHSLALGKNNTTEGQYSLAIGESSTASGIHSIAIGGNATASGYNAFAIGDNAIAQADNAIAIGNGSNANKSYAVAIGSGNTASATGAFALGYNTTAGGKYSVTFGQNTSTAAEGAIVFGNTSKANVGSGSGAYNSLVGGYFSESAHNATIVVGNQLRSANINGAVFGQYNSIEGLGATVNDRALLILGNGSNDSARSNAFVVLRDGRIILGSGSHGTTLPANGFEGQIFFLES